MSTLIRPGQISNAALVSAPQWRPLSQATAADAEPVLTAEQIRIQDLEEALAQQRIAHIDDLKRERSEAKNEAEAAFKRDETASLAALEKCLSTAAESLARRIGDLEALAPLLCEIALEGVLARAEDYGDLVERALERQLADIRGESVLKVAVSGADFHDDNALSAMTGRHPGLRIERDAMLPAGSCRIDLRLGQIELSLPNHWRDLQTRLRTLASQ
ncbi:MAG: hypothetical protein H7124_05520 [Phycisphaerales bacterium]|nr:hypothetical protein [Hyphomonadaceae bacterium]